MGRRFRKPSGRGVNIDNADVRVLYFIERQLSIEADESMRKYMWTRNPKFLQDVADKKQDLKELRSKLYA